MPTGAAGDRVQRNLTKTFYEGYSLLVGKQVIVSTLGTRIGVPTLRFIILMKKNNTDEIRDLYNSWVFGTDLWCDVR